MYPNAVVFNNFFRGTNVPCWDWYPRPTANGSGHRFPLPGMYRNRTAMVGSYALACAPWRHVDACKDTILLQAYYRDGGFLPGNDRLRLSYTQSWAYRMKMVMNLLTDARNYWVTNVAPRVCEFHWVVKEFLDSTRHHGYDPSSEGYESFVLHDADDYIYLMRLSSLRNNIRENQAINPHFWRIDWEDITTLVRRDALLSGPQLPRDFRYLEWRRYHPRDRQVHELYERARHARYCMRKSGYLVPDKEAKLFDCFNTDAAEYRWTQAPTEWN